MADIHGNILVAKRSSPAKRLVGERRILIPADRVKLLNRFRRRLKRPPLKRQPRSAKHAKPTPSVTPADRRSVQADESDSDILQVTEEIHFASPVKARGQLLRRSTLKPVASKVARIQKPDPVPANCVDTTKRIVRIVHSPPRPATLGITLVPQTRSIGVQVGTPSVQLQVKPIAPPAEPPLRSYWTHHVNLPYPPSHVAQQQSMVNVPQQHAAHYYQPAYVPSYSPSYAQPQVNQHVTYQQPSRRQRRNVIKKQKYMQRHQYH